MSVERRTIEQDRLLERAPHLRDQTMQFLQIMRSNMVASLIEGPVSPNLDIFNLPEHVFSTESMAEFANRTAEFANDSNEMVAIWHSQEMRELRERENKIQGVDENRKVKSPVYKVKCIDGRKPRAYEGTAHSLKSEKAQVAIEIDDTNGEIVPKGKDIHAVLSDITVEPVEMSMAHYDSTNSHHGCAAMELVLNDIMQNWEGTWKFLSDHEKQLVTDAASRSQEYANLVLLELTNRRAFTNIHNKFRQAAGVEKLNRVNVTVLYDTRTMGIDIVTPILTRDENNQTVLTPEENQQKLSTTQITEKYASVLEKMFGDSLPKAGSFKETFTKKEHFVDYYRAMVDITEYLASEGNPVPKIGPDGVEQFVPGNALYQEVNEFITRNYAEMTDNQKQALRVRLIRTVAHQYLTGLYQPQEHHPFSDHGEKFMSVAKDGNYPGKHIIEYQCFRMSGPDAETAEKRLEISNAVMNKINVDEGKPHVSFVSATIRKEDWENRNVPGQNGAYNEALSQALEYYHSLVKRDTIKGRIKSKEYFPVPVFISRETGEVLEVIVQGAGYIGFKDQKKAA